MKTFSEIFSVAERIRYKNWALVIGMEFGTPYLQVRFVAVDNATGHLSDQYGRKWLLSWHMTDSEIVQTALKAVLAAEEHEAREQFLVDGKAIFGPHIKLDALLLIAGAAETRRSS